MPPIALNVTSEADAGGRQNVRNVHRAAVAGFTAGAEKYARGRPEYPREIDEWLRLDLALGKGRTVLDLGAGTGKFSTYLLKTQADVVAVEPVEAMREQLMRRHPGIAARAGSAEQIPMEDATVDAVVCAQAFHWFANGAALTEILRVLKPGGRLGLVWNVRDESVAWVAAITRIIEPFEADTPRFQSQQWRSVFPFPGVRAAARATLPQPALRVAGAGCDRPHPVDQLHFGTAPR